MFIRDNFVAPFPNKGGSYDAIYYQGPSFAPELIYISKVLNKALKSFLFLLNLLKEFTHA